MTDSAINATSSRPRLVYRLDDLTIDVGTAQVRRLDQALLLPRLSFDLLLALVKAAPNLVTVDELMDQVWPGVVVNAETVSQRIKLLRLALADDAKQPRYIAVSRGRGYRIVGTVTKLEATEPVAVAPTATSPKLPRWAWAAMAALLLAGLATAFLLPRNHPPANPATSTTALPDRSVAVLPFDNLGQSPEDAALAFGVAETLLHRLSASKDVTVIARQSSFSFAPRGADVRDIGRRLNARYLVEGSLQSTTGRLRITAQLIDATTGSHVWSLQFDRKPEDIFVIQDEIAAKVSEALQTTLAGPTPAAGRGTQDFDAYLAHAQGRARLATTRVPDAKLAIADFERAIQIDPKYARAYAGLAEARMFVAYAEMSRERQSNIDKVWEENRQLLEHALEINELDADTHLQLADMYWEGDRAEKELARALALNPNSAPAYQLLSNVRMLRDRLPDEAMIAIDKARLLSPLEVGYDNEKARIALYGKSDAKLAEQLSLSVLNRDPSSTAALWRLGETYWCCQGQPARGIKYLEQALQRDPDFEFGRRMLILAYLDLDDAKEAEAVAASAPHPVNSRLVPVLAHARDWHAAVERSYEEDRLGTGQAVDSGLRVFALRVDIRTTRDYENARQHMTNWAGISWDASGQPVLPGTWMADGAIGLADILLQMGEREKAQQLIDSLLKSIDDEIHARGRGEFWYLRQLPVLYALLGRDDEALAMLEKCAARKYMPELRLYLADDPAYERLRSHPRFRAVVEQVERYSLAQRRELDEMRATSLAPHRSR
jgi:TolB-like protein/DNA-binding winged helix-turn-helix (wHTH) protein/cytochrome c-type biogenesis protein CcmH/NrfG